MTPITPYQQHQTKAAFTAALDQLQAKIAELHAVTAAFVDAAERLSRLAASISPAPRAGQGGTP